MAKKPEYVIVPYKGWSPYVGRHGVFYELWRNAGCSWIGIDGVPMRTCSSVEELMLYAAKAGIKLSDTEFRENLP